MTAARAACCDTAGGLIRWAALELSGHSQTPRLDAEVLLVACTGLPRSRLIAFPEAAVPPPAIRRYRALIERRRAGAPVAQLTGRKEFYSLSLAVTPDVLVPRPETELLVEEALRRLPENRVRRVLDVGTGSGAIALAIKHERRRADVTAVDFDLAALAVARRNARELGLAVKLLRSNWFAQLNGERFDLIASNPPYVASDDPHLAALLRFEPRVALDGGSDGLAAIRILLSQAPEHLRPGGCMVLEHGYRQRGEVEALAAEAGWTIEAARRDLAGHDRVLALRRARR